MHSADVSTATTPMGSTPRSSRACFKPPIPANISTTTILRVACPSRPSASCDRPCNLDSPHGLRPVLTQAPPPSKLASVAYTCPDTFSLRSIQCIGSPAVSSRSSSMASCETNRGTALFKSAYRWSNRHVKGRQYCTLCMFFETTDCRLSESVRTDSPPSSPRFEESKARLKSRELPTQPAWPSTSAPNVVQVIVPSAAFLGSRPTVNSSIFSRNSNCSLVGCPSYSPRSVRHTMVSWSKLST